MFSINGAYSLVITGGCPGLARALETVYRRIGHQRCWVHKMRNILEKVKREVRKGTFLTRLDKKYIFD